MIIFAREPIFTPDDRVFAYQLSISEELEESIVGEQTLESNHLAQKLLLNDLMDGFVTVINFTSPTLINNLSKEVLPSDTIIEIQNPRATRDSLSKLIELRNHGFRFVAANQQHIDDETSSLFDYVKYQITSRFALEQHQKIKELARNPIKSIAVGVNDEISYALAKQYEFDYFQGFFYLDKEISHSDEIPAGKLAVLQLVSEINNTELDIDKLEKIFALDATLSYLLMRYINNPLVNKSREILSIRHALSYLGEVMIKKFIAIVSLTKMNDGNTPELLQVSLVRAKFCELIALQKAGKKEAMTAFMAGLFSLIDIILGRDMGLLLLQVTLPSQVNEALLEQRGPLFQMIKASRGFEAAHWKTLSAALESLSLDVSTANSLYVHSIRWANECGIPDSPNFPVTKV